MISVRLRLSLGLAAALTTLTASSEAQVTRRTGDSRAQITARARAADSLGRKEEAFLLFTRLREGDFAVGDRIIVRYEGIALNGLDTLIVRDGKTASLGRSMGVLPVDGLLRFELRDSINARVATYYKNVVTTVTPLLRLSVIGAVRFPGFQYHRSDTPLSDVLMGAGGQDQTTDLRNIVVKRGETTIWVNEDVQSALANGMTLDQLDLQPGDEVVVGARQPNRWTLVAQVAASLATALLVSMTIRR